MRSKCPNAQQNKIYIENVLAEICKISSDKINLNETISILKPDPLNKTSEFVYWFLIDID